MSPALCPDGKTYCDPTQCQCCPSGVPCPGTGFPPCKFGTCPKCATDSDCNTSTGEACVNGKCVSSGNGGGGSSSPPPTSGLCPDGKTHCDPTQCQCCPGGTPCPGTQFPPCTSNTCPKCASNSDCNTSAGEVCDTSTGKCKSTGTGGTTGPNAQLCRCDCASCDPASVCPTGTCNKTTGLCEPKTGLAGTKPHTITVENNTKETLWIGVTPNPGYNVPMNGGFSLAAGATQKLDFKRTWGGRLWARTGCSTSTGTCETGDCQGKGLECQCVSGIPPATVVEITFDGGSGSTDYYDVSLVDGYNIPVTVRPDPSTVSPAPSSVASELNCKEAGCVPQKSIDAWCPDELKYTNGSGKTVGCLSACKAFPNNDQYCCQNAYACSPNTVCSCATTQAYGCCKTFDCPTNACNVAGQPGSIPCDPNKWPVNYAAVFQGVCPKAYSFQFDDCTATYQCNSKSADTPSCYIVSFGGSKSGGANPLGNNNSPLSPSTWKWYVFAGIAVAVVALVAYLIWRARR